MNALLLMVLLAGSNDPATTLSSAGSIRAITTSRAAMARDVITAVLPRARAEDVRKGQTEGMHLAANDDTAAANVFWTFGVAIKDGKLDALEDLIEEMADASQADEPGTLIYEWTISADKKAAEVHERYADSEAALRHLASFNQNFAARLMALVEPTGMTVYGNPSAALEQALQGASPVYMEVLGGFAR